MEREIKKIKSRAIPLEGNDVDTDRIIPARFLKCITFDGLGEHAFEDDRLEAKREGSIHPFDNKCFSGASILVANKNFGCGSSREHAPQALLKYGIKAIAGESFAEIFFGNCVSLGIPCITLSHAEIKELQTKIIKNPSTELSIDIEKLKLQDESKDYNFYLSPVVQEQFVKGLWDVTGLLLDNIGEIKKISEKLEYLKW